jgi:uncharacterized protein (UPF0332 family)
MVNASELLNHAKNIFDHGNGTELEYRNVTRIAYYSMYHRLKDIERTLPDPDGFNKNRGSHELVIIKLSYFAEYSFYSEVLKSNKPNRVEADYYLDRQHNKHKAYKTLRAAEKMFLLLDENTQQELA